MDTNTHSTGCQGDKKECVNNICNGCFTKDIIDHSVQFQQRRITVDEYGERIKQSFEKLSQKFEIELEQMRTNCMSEVNKELAEFKQKYNL
jgi:hypothetical protein